MSPLPINPRFEFQDSERTSPRFSAALMASREALPLAHPHSAMRFYVLVLKCVGLRPQLESSLHGCLGTGANEDAEEPRLYDIPSVVDEKA